MKANFTDADLVAAGHLVVDPEARLTEPVRLAGNYKSTRGFWHAVWWEAGRTQRVGVSPKGYSDAFQEARGHAEAEHGSWDEGNDFAVRRTIARILTPILRGFPTLLEARDAERRGVFGGSEGGIVQLTTGGWVAMGAPDHSGDRMLWGAEGSCMRSTAEREGLIAPASEPMGEEEFYARAGEDRSRRVP